MTAPLAPLSAAMAPSVEVTRVSATLDVADPTFFIVLSWLISAGVLTILLIHAWLEARGSDA